MVKGDTARRELTSTAKRATLTLIKRRRDDKRNNSIPFLILDPCKWVSGDSNGCLGRRTRHNPATAATTQRFRDSACETERGGNCALLRWEELRIWGRGGTRLMGNTVPLA